MNGFIGDDAASIREHLQLLLSDDDLAREMGAASRAMAVREFDEARWRAQWRELIGAWAASPL